jgi:WD40 repeat protein
MFFYIDVYVDVCCFSTTGFFIIAHCSKNDAYCVWNSITLQRVDQRKLPVSRFNDKRGKRRSERCDRCVCQQSKDLIPYETLDDDIPIQVIYYGIYNGMECVFHLYPRLIRVIERTHFTSVSAWDKLLLRLESFAAAAMLTFIASGDEYFLLSRFNDLFLLKFKRVSTMQVQSSPSPCTRVMWSAFSPDSTRLATCTSDGQVNIWNVDTCHVYQRFKDNIGTDEVACCWLSEYLFVCHMSDGILSLSKYPVDANVKVLFTQRHVVYICVVLNNSLTSTILDFSEGYLYFQHGSYPVKFLDVRRPEQGCSVLNLPKYKPGMKIKVLNDSFLSGNDNECIFLWKRNEEHPTIYEISPKVDLDGWNPVYCFSDDLKYLFVSRYQSFSVVDVDGRGSQTVQKTDRWIKAWFVD